MINKDFENLAQRSIYYFLATYPSFYPINSSNVRDTEQKEAYKFIKDIYQNLFRDPALLGFRPLPDDSLGDREQNKDKPYLSAAIRKNIKRIEEFIALLWNISLQDTVDLHTLTMNNNEIKVEPSDIRLLTATGVKVNKLDNSYLFSFPISVNGLKLLAEISKTNVRPPKNKVQKPYLLYSRGVFAAASPWSREVFGNMLEDRRPFDRLLDFLEQTGYQRIDNKEYDNKISLDYIKHYGSAEDELKAAWAERTHGGIEVIYEELRRNQFVISLRIPYFKEVLENTDKMNEQVKTFIITTSKKCDGCRYCVQTDKSGKRPLACITIEKNKLCPFFPGFYYRWKTLENKTMESIIETLRFIDELFADRRC